MIIKCPICLNNRNKIKNLLCFHSFCKNCWEKWEENCIKDKRPLTCPLCKRIVNLDISDNEVKILSGDYFQRFTGDKIELE